MYDRQRVWYLKGKEKLQTAGCLFLILATPPTVILFWFINVFLQGSISDFWQISLDHGFFNVLYNIWSPIFFGSFEAWKILLIFAATQLILMKLVPGKMVDGPVSPKGNVPTYKANGVWCFIITLAAFSICSFHLHIFSPTIIYDHFGGLLGALNIFSLIFCSILLIKGHLFPSSTDVGFSGNLLFDYYWGTELYPRILGWDVKMFTNCRFALMSWPLIILSFAAKQQELYGLSDSMIVAVALQLIYVAKFFYWETGYLRSLDIMHDRAGYYICWGCLVWVPGIYSSSTLYLVNHPNNLGLPVSLLIFIAGSLCIAINFLADRQRQRVRTTSGSCLIWHNAPRILKVNYQTEEGFWKENLLLLSGWWGLSRHFHYVPEVLGALCWSLPALFDHFIPYFYVIFLAILLTERAFRDDKRCADKYGNGWEDYCKHVPYKIIPYII